MAISTIGSDGLATGAVTSTKLTSGVPTRSQLPAGTVLQVIQTSLSTEVVVASVSAVDLGLSATITPISSSSKVLAVWSIQAETATTNGGFGTGLVRNATTVFGNANTYEVYNPYTSDFVLTRAYLDSPATTSATTYKIQVRTYSGQSVQFQNDSLYASTLTLMEIAA